MEKLNMYFTRRFSKVPTRIFVFIGLILIQIFLMLTLSYLSFNSNNTAIKNRILNEWDVVFNEPPLERYTLCFSSQLQSAQDTKLSTLGNALMNYGAFSGEPCKALNDYILSDNEIEIPVGDYSRQWSGTTIVTRITLTFMNLSSLQYLIFSAFIVSIVLLTNFLIREINKIFSIMFLVFFVTYLDVPSWINNIAYSLVYSFCIFLSLIVRKMNVEVFSLKTFLAIFSMGMWLNFFDLFLTSSLLTIMLIAFPLIIDRIKQHWSFWKNAKSVSFLTFTILFGYIFSWILKWFFTFIFGDRNIVITGAKNAIISRTSLNSSEGRISDWLTIVFNTFKFLQTKPLDGNFFLLLIIVNFIFIVFFLYRDPRRFFNQIPFYFFTLSPFVFFLLIPNWSSIHTFISYRALVFSLLIVTSLNFINYKNLRVLKLI